MQFSWTANDGWEPEYDSEAWGRSLVIAEQVLTYSTHGTRQTSDPSRGATHYHATTMNRYPNWSKNMRETVTIGNHIFYRAHGHTGG